MTTNRKPPGVIHKIREFELEKIHLSDEFDILQIVGEGWFGKILLVEHRATDTEMVLKALPKPYVSLRDFYREFHYGLHLGLHKNIVTTYDVAFETAGFYVFTQEYAPLGDLTSNVAESGIGELHSKRVAKQIASALDYMHSKSLVHRDVKLDNVLIYKSDFSRVKLCDFGESYKTGTEVERRNEWLPYSPPEVLQIKTEGNYKAETSHDVWQFGIVIFVCLTGCLPWQKAAPDDPRYVRYVAWQATNMVLPLRRTPKLFKLLSSKGSRMFRKFLEPREERRPRTLIELSKFTEDRWLAKGAEKDLAENEQDELCASMYSFHSSPEEKNKLLSTLAEYGIETTVDRAAKKNRIKDWIESSVINEEDEDEDSGSNASSPTISQREPIPGHISSVRAQEAEKQINTTLKDASQKHFDPRTGALQSGPSEMGAVLRAAESARALVSNGNGSVVTLASRNDLIMSEGQSFHSNLNLNMLDDGATSEPMVNARQNQHEQPNVSLNDNNNLTALSNMYLYDAAPSRINAIAANTAANQTLYYRSSVLANHRHSASALQVNLAGHTNYSYATATPNINNNNNNYSYYNSFSNSSAAYGQSAKSSLTNFQSVANISVPEDDDRQQFSSLQIKDSGYGSYDKIRSTPINDSLSGGGKRSESPVPAKRFATNSAATFTTRTMSNNNEKLPPPPTTTTTTNDRNLVINRIPTGNFHSNHQNNLGSMKDTPYDRIKIKKVNSRV